VACAAGASINYAGSGLRTVALGYQALLNGDSEIVVAGGQESMSMAPHAQYLARRRQDGAGRIRRHHDQGRSVGCLQRLPHGQYRRERRQAVPDHARQQDEFAVGSQNKAEAAQKAGRFKDEIGSRHHQVPQGRHRGGYR